MCAAELKSEIDVDSDGTEPDGPHPLVVEELETLLCGRLQGRGITGSALGPTVVYQQIRYGTTRTTYVDVDLPMEPHLFVYMRRLAETDESRIRRGKLLHVRLDEPELDGAFLIQIAPTPVVKRLLSPALRAALLELDGPKLRTQLYDQAFRDMILPSTAKRLAEPTRTTVIEELLGEAIRDHRALRLEFSGWLDEPARARQLVEALVQFSQGVPAAFATFDGELATSDGEAPSASELEAARANRERELALFKAKGGDSAGSTGVITLFVIIIGACLLVVGELARVLWSWFK